MNKSRPRLSLSVPRQVHYKSFFGAPSETESFILGLEGNLFDPFGWGGQERIPWKAVDVI
jgi:hypothetical protein